jgi:hypothetical protein
VDGVQWNDAELEDLLNSIDGPVGRWLTDKAEEMAGVATAASPLQKPENWSWGRHSTSYLPRSFGYLKGSIRPKLGYTKDGKLYGGVNAAYGPTLFLEQPARQMHSIYPFLSVALYAATIDLP